MNLLLVGVLLLFCVLALVATAILLDIPIPGFGAMRGDMRRNMRAIVSAQRTSVASARKSGGSPKESIVAAAEQEAVKRVVSSKLTLRKKLRYAQWKIEPVVYRAAQVTISLIVAGVLSLYMNLFVVLISLLSGPLFMGWLLNMAVERRFKAFDADYPAFLLSVVGLLKTGMNAMSALEAAANGLEEGSLVKTEVIMMIERLRYGVPEEKSVGSFGEDIFHPEIELFVQALLLSRRVGGTLSDTLDRLAKQVRKRQYFRASAVAAVSMQRGSIWFIIAILFGIELYLYFMFPESVIDAWNHPIGWQVWQGAVLVILLGIFWVRQVTKIRV